MKYPKSVTMIYLGIPVVSIHPILETTDCRKGRPPSVPDLFQYRRDRRDRVHIRVCLEETAHATDGGVVLVRERTSRDGGTFVGRNPEIRVECGDLRDKIFFGEGRHPILRLVLERLVHLRDDRRNRDGEREIKIDFQKAGRDTRRSRK